MKEIYNKILTIVFFVFILFKINSGWAHEKDSVNYVIINPNCKKQIFEGFGVSLCWWANMCGKWSDEKINEIIDWMVSPDGLNYRVFRYNIGGGDDPDNKNCTPHHMANGKGLRAEMEGFKDSSEDPYIWSRDEAQRKILLKIKDKRPDAIFEAFSNSSPWWMTYSGCCAGALGKAEITNNLKPEYYDEFACYLLDVCKHYKEEYDIEFRCISPFNEPEWVGWKANGSQEGCDFSIEAQINFIKVLADEISKYGLNIDIAAPEINNSYLYTPDFDSYNMANIIPLINKWNVHTYNVKTEHRTQIDMLCKQFGIPIWVSESGPIWPSYMKDTNGIAGNLLLAKRLIEDIKYMGVTAWLDWQYIESGNDQWCLVRSDDFSEDNFVRNKNYFIRSHFSRFINNGFNIMTSVNENTLVAQSPDNDKIIIVIVNTESSSSNYIVDLTMYDEIGSVEGFITTENKDLEYFNDQETFDKSLKFSIPQKSIITFSIPVSYHNSTGDITNLNNSSFLIYPRCAEGWVIESTDTLAILAKPRKMANQKWSFEDNDAYFAIKNDKNQYLSLSNNKKLLTSNNNQTSKELFELVPVDDSFQYYLIKSRSEDLFLAVKDYSYNDKSVLIFDSIAPKSIPTNYHWGLLRTDDNSVNRRESVSSDLCEHIKLNTSIPGNLQINRSSILSDVISIYSSLGQIVYRAKLSGCSINIPLPSGIYTVSHQCNNRVTNHRILVK